MPCSFGLSDASGCSDVGFIFYGCWLFGGTLHDLSFGAFSMMLRLSASRCLGSWDTLQGDSSRSDNLRPTLPGRLPCILSSRRRRTSGRLARLRSRRIARLPFPIRFAVGVCDRRALLPCISGRRLSFWDFGFALSRHRFHMTVPNQALDANHE